MWTCSAPNEKCLRRRHSSSRTATGARHGRAGATSSRSWTGSQGSSPDATFRCARPCRAPVAVRDDEWRLLKHFSFGAEQVHIDLDLTTGLVVGVLANDQVGHVHRLHEPERWRVLSIDLRGIGQLTGRRLTGDLLDDLPTSTPRTVVRVDSAAELKRTQIGLEALLPPIGVPALRPQAHHLVLLELLVRREVPESDREEPDPLRPRRVQPDARNTHRLPGLPRDGRVRLHGHQRRDRLPSGTVLNGSMDRCCEDVAWAPGHCHLRAEEPCLLPPRGATLAAGASTARAPVHKGHPPRPTPRPTPRIAPRPAPAPEQWPSRPCPGGSRTCGGCA